LNIAWWKYLLLAIADVEANFTVVKAYQYTTITSILLLGCFTTPCSMLLSWIFLKRGYKLTHYLGVVFCLLGVGVLVLGDVLNHSKQFTSNGQSYDYLIGDALACLSSICYSISNVGMEFAIKNSKMKNDNPLGNSVEVLMMLGI